jgi:23S rRNA (uracil1939-C5)-methyltransferase
VRECPISSPRINQAIAAMWELADGAAVHPALREAQFFANHDDSALLVELRIDARAQPEELRGFARRLRERMPEIRSVTVIAGGMEADPDEGSEPRAARAERGVPPAVEGASSLEYQVGGESYRVSAGAFFQTNRFLVGRLVELVTHNRSGRAALDLYAGVGLFALPLARAFGRVTAVEIGEASFADLEANAAQRPIRTARKTTDEFLRSARGEWEFAVADPPRAGLGERTAKLLAGLKIPRLTLVSCDPATLARDLAILVAGGYRVEEAHLVDLFPQSYHMETVLHLVR